MDAMETKAKRGRSLVSSVLADGTMLELVLDREAKKTALAVAAPGKPLVLADRFTLPDGSEVRPLSAENNLLRHRAVLLPERPKGCGTTEELVARMEAYIERYVDLSPGFLELASYYLLFTWVYDAFKELPYLRLRGDFGCGKTRALLILGSIAYRPFFASGASTVSPIFHTLDTFKGTLIFDEADFRFSDEKAELVKIFNNGNVRGFPVFRTGMTTKREFDPQAFEVFGPKIVAMRGAFEDSALESRFITEEMGQRPVRKGIPINLPDAQEAEALELRNELLSFRLQNLSRMKIDPSLASPTASHRLNQILVPLLSVITSESVRERVLRAAGQMDQTLQAERSASIEARLLEVLVFTLSGAANERVPLADITAEFTRRHGADFDRPITNRYLGSILQRRLRLFAYKSHGVFVVPVTELSKVLVLATRYGVAVPTGGCGDVGTLRENCDAISKEEES